MRTATIAVTIFALLIVACSSDNSEELAALQEQLSAIETEMAQPSPPPPSSPTPTATSFPQPAVCVPSAGAPCNVTPVGYVGYSEGLEFYFSLLDYQGQGSSIRALNRSGRLLAMDPVSGAWTGSELLPVNFPSDVAWSLDEPSTGYLVGSGFARIRDDWSSWTVLSIPDGSDYLRSVAVHPDDADTVYAGSQHGIYKSIEGGYSWSRLDNGIDTKGLLVWTVAIDPSDPDVVLVGAEYQKDAVEANERGEDGRQFPHSPRFFRSADGGASWKQIDIPGFWNPTDIQFVPGKAGRVLMVTEGRGVYESLDAGVSWAQTWTESPNISDIEFGDSGSHIFISTNPYSGGPGGVYESKNGGRTWDHYWLEHPVVIDIAYVGDGTLVVSAIACPKGISRDAYCSHIVSHPETAYAIYRLKLQ